FQANRLSPRQFLFLAIFLTQNIFIDVWGDRVGWYPSELLLFLTFLVGLSQIRLALPTVIFLTLACIATPLVSVTKWGELKPVSLQLGLGNPYIVVSALIIVLAGRWCRSTLLQSTQQRVTPTRMTWAIL